MNLRGERWGSRFPQAAHSDKLRLTDGIAFCDGADKLQGAELAAIGIRHADDFRPQGSDRRHTRRLFIERGGRDLERKARGPRKIAARGQDGASATDVQNRCEIQKVLPLLVDSACKNRYRKRKPFPSTPLLGIFQDRHQDKRVTQPDYSASTMPKGNIVENHH